MSRSIDRLLDLLNGGPTWTSFTPTVTRSLVKMECAEEMAIIPDTKNGPMLEISFKDGGDLPVFRQRLNLTGVDELIGKLIKMRDHMAQMKSE